MGKRKLDPMRAVKTADLHGGGSLFGPFKYHWWELGLDCGHFVERRIRWLPQDVPKHLRRRGYAAMHRNPTLDRLPPEPKKARCEKCGAAERKAEREAREGN